MSQYGLGWWVWWVSERVDLDRATKVSAREDERAIGDERKVPNSWGEVVATGHVLWTTSMRIHSDKCTDGAHGK